MTPRSDDYEQYDNFSDDDDDDSDGFEEDMAALARACMIAGPNDDAEDEFTAQKDPLLSAGDTIVPLPVADDVGDSDDDDEQSDLECLKRVQRLYQSPDSILPPMNATSDGDDEDDLETYRAIFNRFATYDKVEGGMKTFAEGDHASSLSGQQEVANSSISDKSNTSELCPDSQYPDEDTNTNLLTEQCNFVESQQVETQQADARMFSKLPQKMSSFPPSARAFVGAINKNRALQKFLRSKLIEIEAKIEQNKQLRNKVKLLKDFQVSCSRRTGNALSLKKDPRVQLISTINSKSHKKASAMCYGPAENARVANYKMVLERFPLSLDRKKWSNVERENLSKGIKEQFQKMMHQYSIDRMSSECSFGDGNDIDSIITSVTDLEITPERIREFLPKVNWDELASKCAAGRTGAECESRWLNCEDPLINHGPWTVDEDRSLLIVVQEVGIRNWFDVAVSLATNRTPFQCLARYQRSLNPSMLNSEWTEEEDAQLCSAVAYFGQSDWQSVASILERRTGTQCSNRWKKSLCPVRKGSFTQEEDERLTVAVMLFGRKWNQIAKFVPGRIQSQCRDRYLNSLDPSLKWGGWTEEEDLRLEAAICKYGYCWSKVAEDVSPRTDSQCRKRWKVLCPEQVPLLQEARKRQKSLLASNFVDRESDRPALTLNDFIIPLQMVSPPSDVGAVTLRRKRKRASRNVPKKKRSKKYAEDAEFCPEGVQGAAPKKERPRRRSKKNASLCPEEVQYIEYNDKVNTCGGGVSFFAWSNVPRKTRSRRRARINPEKLNDIAWSDKTCIESLESGSLENTTLSCFLRSTSKKKLSKCTKNARQASLFSGTKVASKQDENQIPSGEQDGLSLSCRTSSGTKELSIQKKVASCRRVRKPKGANSETKSEDTNNLTADGNDMTLACLVRNKSKKWSQAEPTKINLIEEETIVEDTNNLTVDDQGGLSLSCGTSSGTKELSIQKKVASCRRVRKPKGANSVRKSEDLNNLTVDGGDMPLACFVRNKSKKWSQAEPTKINAIEEETVVDDTNNLTVDGDDMPLACFVRNKSKKWSQAEPTKNNVIEEETVVEDTDNLTVDGDDMTLACFVRSKSNKCSQAEPARINVTEEETSVHGVMAKDEAIDINKEEKDDHSSLHNRTSRRQRRVKTHKCSCCQ